MDPDAGEMLCANTLDIVSEQDLRAGLGDALAHQRLRRADHQQRLLDPPAVTDEDLLLPRVLGVVTRIRLVRDDVYGTTRGERHVRIDGDAAPEAAFVVVVRRPRLVADDLEANALVRGQPERVDCSASKISGQPRRKGLELVGSERVAVLPGLPALRE